MNMKKHGRLIQGIRPGKPTMDYLTNVLNSIIFIGAAGLSFASFVPIFVSGAFGADVSFGGTSMIIIEGNVRCLFAITEALSASNFCRRFSNDACKGKVKCF